MAALLVLMGGLAPTTAEAQGALARPGTNAPEGPLVPQQGAAVQDARLSGEEAQAVLSTDELFLRIAEDAPEFGGLHVDEPRELIHVWVTNDSEATRERVRDAVTDHIDMEAEGLDEFSIHFSVGQYGFAQLKQWEERTTPDLLARTGVVHVDIDERINRLVVGVETSDFSRNAPAVSERLQAIGVPTESVRLVEADPVTLESSLQDRHRPLVGGLQIRSTPFICTMGFTALTFPALDPPPPPRYGMVTNSHCTNVRSTVTQTVFHQPNLDIANRIAVESVDPPFFTGGTCPTGRRCRRSDAAFADYDGGVAAERGVIADARRGSPDWDGVGRHYIRARGSGFVGNLVGKTGRSTGRTTGRVERTCTNVNVANTDITLLCQDQASYASTGGDSGSPVYRWINTTCLAVCSDNLRLIGIHWGSGGWFSPWPGVQAELGAQLGILMVCTPEEVC